MKSLSQLSQKTILFFLLAVTMSISLHGQKFFTRAGQITFHSDAPLEKIEATNGSVTSVLDTETNRLQFAALIKAFQFEKALMQEHFNENYMESSKFPKATFAGEIVNAGEVDWSADGTYEVKVDGKLSIHGVENEVSVPATIVIKGGKITANSSFIVAVADYEIEIPGVVADNIAKEVEIMVDINYEALQQ
ncbi:polyisoprenoid-binding protein [Lewinellaceae bacterium SD302]|nr:polyisoprenoid-binding protein [Lewinellaceae bacterium SD302]